MRSSRPVRAGALALALVLGAALGGCGEPPKPFAHEGDPQNPLLQVANPEGVAIVGLTGFSSNGQGKFLDTLVEQFHRAEVPALVGEGNAQSYRLAGTVMERKAESGVELTMLWQMVNASNQTVGSQVMRQIVDARAWRDGDAALMTTLARQTGAAVLPMLPKPVGAQSARNLPPVPAEPSAAANIVPPMGTRAQPPRGPARPQVAQVGPSASMQTAQGGKPAKDKPPVALRPIEGAPGDGAESLSKALSHFLALANVPIVSEHDAPFGVVAGQVTLTSINARVQNVKIEWILYGVSGCQMGTVSQANQIPAGKLDGSWGDAAYAVAEGAVQGLTDLLDQLEAMPEGKRCKR